MFFCHFGHGNHFFVQFLIKLMFKIQDIGNAPAHSGGKVFPGWSQDHCTSAGHIFQTVVAAAFGYCCGP